MTEEIKTDAVVKYDKSLALPVATPTDLRKLLLANRISICKLIPPTSDVTWEKVISAIMELHITKPDILKCDGYSIIIAVKNACELGLSFIPSAGEAHLVPFWDKKAHRLNCKLMPGYRGKQRLIIENSDVVDANAVVVYKDDIKFEPYGGTNPHIVHAINPSGLRTNENIVGVYSVAFYKNGFVHFDYMTKEEIDANRTRSKSSNSGPWVTDYPEQGKKAVQHRHYKRIPVSGKNAHLIHKLLQEEYEVEGLSNPSLPSIKPEDRMKQLMDRLHNPQEEEQEEPPKEQPPAPKKVGEVIDLPEETPLDMVEEGFKYAGIMDKNEQARLTKKFEGRQDVLNNYLNLLADWDSDQEQGTRPDEPE